MELQWFVSAKLSLRNRHITASKNPSSSIRQDRKIPLCQRTSSKARQDQWKRQKRTPCNMNNCNSVTEQPLFRFFRFFFHVLFPLPFLPPSPLEDFSPLAAHSRHNAILVWQANGGRQRQREASTMHTEWLVVRTVRDGTSGTTMAPLPIQPSTATTTTTRTVFFLCGKGLLGMKG